MKVFAQPCFACHVSAISFGMVKAWIETILHVFGRLGVSFVDAWSVCEVTQVCSLSPELLVLTSCELFQVQKAVY